MESIDYTRDCPSAVPMCPQNLPFETEFAEKTLPLDWKMTAAEFLAWLRPGPQAGSD